MCQRWDLNPRPLPLKVLPLTFALWLAKPKPLAWPPKVGTCGSYIMSSPEGEGPGDVWLPQALCCCSGEGWLSLQDLEVAGAASGSP